MLKNDELNSLKLNNNIIKYGIDEANFLFTLSSCITPF